ncbi:MAG: hypothetical protein AAF401_09515, partial [Pseudomonadota bacterium]
VAPLRFRHQADLGDAALLKNVEELDHLAVGDLAITLEADYREYQLSQKANVETYLDSALTAEQILEFGFSHICLATGSTWRRDGVSRQHVVPPLIDPGLTLLTPDDVMAGSVPFGRVVLWDDDHYYLGGVLAELLVQNGCDVTMVTTSQRVSDWTFNTLEHHAIHKRLAEIGVKIILNRGIAQIAADRVISDCVFTGEEVEIEADAVVMVASRVGDDVVFRDLKAREADWADAGISSVRLIGDAEAPGPIAWATYAGHRYARELEEPEIGDALPFRREVTELAAV